jgi:hypothetical protein
MRAGGAAQDLQHHPRSRDLRTSAIAIRDAHNKTLRSERLTARQSDVFFPAFHLYAAIAGDRVCRATKHLSDDDG